MKLKNPVFLLLALLAVSVLSMPAYGEALDHKLAGDGYLKKGLIAPAIIEYKQAIVDDPASTAAYFNLAIAYYASGQVAEATRNLEILLKLSPRDTEATYNLACLKLYLGEVEEAEKCFQEASASCGENSRFKTLTENGLSFLNELKKLRVQTQQSLFTLLRQGVIPAFTS